MARTNAHLARAERVSAATPQQALNALVLLQREVAAKAQGDFGDLEQARRRTRVPVVLAVAECRRLFERRRALCCPSATNDLTTAPTHP